MFTLSVIIVIIDCIKVAETYELFIHFNYFTFWLLDSVEGNTFFRVERVESQIDIVR